MKYCSPKLFQGQGLEITITLLPSSECTSALYTTEALTIAGGGANKAENVEVNLTIKNVYLSVVHMMNSANLSLSKVLPYTTFHHLRYSLG